MSSEDVHAVHSSNLDDGNMQIKPTDTEAQDSIMLDASPSKDEAKTTTVSTEEAPKSASASSKSSSFYPESRTSTEEYDQTPFVDFSKQVTQLCNSLWPPSVKEYRIQRLLGGPNNRFLGVLRSKKLGRYLWPPSPPKAFDIERMSGGSFNRVVGIKIIGSEKEDPIPLVLRTSRYLWDSHPAREVAILEYIRQHTKVPVPHIKAFDLTEENPLKIPYVIQNRIPGVCLTSAIANGLSHKQWCIIAKEIAHVILELQTIGNSTPGLIETSTKDDGVNGFSICPFDIKNPRDPMWKEKRANSVTLEDDNAKALRWYEKDTFHFLAVQFGRWRAEQLQASPISIIYEDEMRRLTDTVAAMNRLGVLGNNKNCMVHMDLAARNIMVELGSDDSIRMTGVLDWDSAIFAPQFVSCRPPWWLWQDERFPEDAMEDETNAEDGPGDDPELIEVKNLFDDTMGEEYVKYAYQSHYRLARKVFQIALYGNYSAESMREINEILDEWAAFYKAEVEDYVPENEAGSLESENGGEGSVSGEEIDSHD